MSRQWSGSVKWLIWWDNYTVISIKLQLIILFTSVPCSFVWFIVRAIQYVLIFMPKPLKHILGQFPVRGLVLITTPTDLVGIAFAFGVNNNLHRSWWPRSNAVHWEWPIIDKEMVRNDKWHCVKHGLDTRPVHKHMQQTVWGPGNKYIII